MTPISRTKTHLSAQQLRHKTGRTKEIIKKKSAEGQSWPFSQRVNGQEKTRSQLNAPKIYCR